jgi:hypothetical protein
MNFKVILCAVLIIELTQFIDAKRSFGITSRRSKSKSPSVRRGQHGHETDDHVPLPKPSSDSKKNIGWDTQKAHNTHHHPPSAPPMNPAQTNQGGLYSANSGHHQPPPYGMHHNTPYGAPPAYSQGFNNQHRPAYGANPPAYNAHPAYNAPPAYGAPMGATPFGSNMGYSGGSPMMGMPVMGVMPMQTQSRGSGIGSGIMTNLFAGLAGYQLARAFSGGSSHNYNHRDRDVIIINNPPAQTATAVDGSTSSQPVGPVSNAYPQTPLNPPPSAVASAPSSSSASDESEEAPTQNVTAAPPQLMPANNEYNYWKEPQYGIALYGYNLPSQITEYYQIDTIKLNHDSQQQQQQEQTATSS